MTQIVTVSLYYTNFLVTVAAFYSTNIPQLLHKMPHALTCYTQVTEIVSTNQNENNDRRHFV